MSILDRLERRLEQLVEGLFARAFRGATHPVDVARALTRAMDERTIVSLSRTYAPNEFRVSLDGREFEAWAPVAPQIAEEIEAYLADYATERRYVLPGRVRVTIAAAEEAPGPDGIRIEAGLSQPAPDALDQTTLFEPPDEDGIPAPAAQGILLASDGLRYLLSAEPVVLGRGDGCSIVLRDAAASREHARLERGTEGWILLDLGSKNGTYVNGERIDRHPIRPGDRIRIGGTTLDFQAAES